MTMQKTTMTEQHQLHERLWTKKGASMARAVGVGAGMMRVFFGARHCR